MSESIPSPFPSLESALTDTRGSEPHGADAQSAKQAILVLGMHRSGTSALTRVLSLCGAALPQNLMAAVKDVNDQGFWEAEALANLHDELLASAGSCWYDLGQFPASWFSSLIAQQFKQRALTLLAEEYGTAPLLVIKDPRICRLIPFWLDVLETFGASPKVVIPVRNPMEVAASLNRRDGFGLHRALLLWLQHFLAAERDTRSLPRIFVNYEALLADWTAVVSQIGQQLDIHFPNLSHRSSVEINEFLDPELKHHHSADALAHRSDIVDWLQQAYAWAARACEAPQLDPTELDDIYRQYQTAEKAYFPVVVEFERRALNNSEMLALRQSLQTHETAKVQFEKKLQELTATTQQQQTNLQTLRQQLQDRNQAFAQLQDTKNTLHQQLQERSQAASRFRDMKEDLHLRLQERIDVNNHLLAVKEDLQQKLQEQVEALNHLRQSKENLQAQVNSSTDTLAQLQRAVQDQAAQLQSQAVANQTLRLQIHRQQAHIRHLSDVLRDRNASLRTLRIDLAAQQKQLLDVTQAQSTAEPQEGSLKVPPVAARPSSQFPQQDVSVINCPEDVSAQPGQDSPKAVHSYRDGTISMHRSKPLKQVALQSLKRGKTIIYWALTLQLPKRLRFEQKLQQLLHTPLFDEIYYLATYPDVRSQTQTMSAPEHFLKYGAAEGRNPSLFFDTCYYLSQSPDLQESGVNPLIHYIEYGGYEGRDPHPLFDSSYYLLQNPDIAGSGVNPLEHFLRFGAFEGRSPHPLFYLPAYINNHPELKKNTSVNPFTYYLMRGGSWQQRQLKFPQYDHPEVSIIIPVYNQIDYTLRCLKALQRQAQEIPCEIIVADDNSTDETGIILQRDVQGIHYHHNANNLGFLKNCNAASQMARGEYIVLLNNDTVPQPHWLEELLKPFKEPKKMALGNSPVGLVGSMLIYPNGRLQEAGGLIFEDGSGWNYGRGKKSEDCEYNFVRETDYCSAASVALPHSLWKTLGGFDERYAPAYYEDTDLAFRVREAGYRVVYTPFSKIKHFEGVSSGTDLNSGVKQNQVVNRPKFLERWQKTISHHPLPTSPEFSVRRRFRKHWLLWIDSYTPLPDQDSGSIDTFNFLKTTLEYGWGVTFVPYHNPKYGGRYTEVLQRMGVECFYLPHFKSLEKFLATNGKEYDVVVLSRVTVAQYVLPLVQQYAPAAKIIFNTVDLHFLRHQRELSLGKPDLNENAQIVVEDMRMTELGIIRQSDLTIVISEQEADVVRAYEPDASLAVLPIGREIPGRTTGFEDRKHICFVGGFNHTPNVDAVHYFREAIWPLVRRQLPQCHLIIVGSNVPATIQKLDGGSIEVKGFLPDLKELFSTVRLSVAPLRYGAGMKGKVVTSLSYGVPVVATPIAAEGMNLHHGEHCMIAEEPQEFADWIVKVYSSPELWETLSAQGLALVKEKFSTAAIQSKIWKILDESCTSDMS